MKRVVRIHSECVWQNRQRSDLALPPPRALPPRCPLPLQFPRIDRFLLNTSLLTKWQVSGNKLSWQDTSDLLRQQHAAGPVSNRILRRREHQAQPWEERDGEQGHQHRLRLPAGTQEACSACFTAAIRFHYETRESRCFALSVEQARAQGGLRRSAVWVAGGSSWFRSH